jgi:hypothetical protein
VSHLKDVLQGVEEVEFLFCGYSIGLGGTMCI